MPYSAKINRANPSCFLFVIDESGSMDESMESGRSKAQFVADVLNKTLAGLIPRCTKADGVRAYFDVGVITYSGFGVGSGLGGNLSEASSTQSRLSIRTRSGLRSTTVRSRAAL